MDDQIWKILEDMKKIVEGQGEIKVQISEVRVRLEELQKAQDTYAATNERDHKSLKEMIKEYEDDRDKEIETLWSEIGMLKSQHKEHERHWYQVKGIKAVIWVGIPVVVNCLWKVHHPTPRKTDADFFGVIPSTTQAGRLMIDHY